jgi:cytochrome P450
LDELTADGGQVDITTLFNFVSFDTMADLCFWDSLNLLAKNEFSPWVHSILESIRLVPAFSIVAYYPILNMLFKKFQPNFLLEQRSIQWQYAVDQVNQRLENPARPDIWNLVLKAEGSKKALSLDEMHSNAEIFILAGSETTGEMHYYIWSTEPRQSCSLTRKQPQASAARRTT